MNVPPAHAAPRSIAAYVGSYAPHGEGIYGFAFDTATGQLRRQSLTPSTLSPSALAVDVAAGRLYSVDEQGAYDGTSSGSVSTYAIDGEADAGGALRLLGRVPSGGAGPVHLSLHPHGRHAFVAHYGGASVAVLPRTANGLMGPPSDVQSTATAVGGRPDAARAAQAPPGSFALSGHEAPHAHMAISDLAGRFVVATDLGLDALVVWRFEAGRGRLLAPQVLRSSAGAGPRHMAFQPGAARRLYVLNEESSTLAWFLLDDQLGSLQALGEVSALPAGFAGTSFASDLRFGPGGRFLYALNRLHDSVAIFKIAADGRPQLLGHEWTRGSYPRSCGFSPDGRWLVVCNQRSDHLTVFAVAAEGGLRFTGQYVPVGSPAAIVFAG